MYSDLKYILKTYQADIGFTKLTEGFNGGIPYRAPDISGYSFLCHIGVWSNRFVGNPYLLGVFSQQTSIWDKTRYSMTLAGEESYTCCSLYIKNIER